MPFAAMEPVVMQLAFAEGPLAAAVDYIEVSPTFQAIQIVVVIIKLFAIAVFALEREFLYSVLILSNL